MKTYIHSFFLLLFTLNAWGNDVKISFRVPPGISPTQIIGNNLRFNSNGLNQIFAGIHVQDYYHAYPTAFQFSHPLAEGLQRVYAIECIGNENDILTQLQNATAYGIDRIYLLSDAQLLSMPCETNDAQDADWNLSRHDLMCVREAWCETQGSPDIHIAIFDVGFDINNPDLMNKIDFVHPDAFVGIHPDDGCHGTESAGAAAAETNNGFGISSSGYDTRLMFYPYGFDSYDLMMDASLRGADIINMSWGGCINNSDHQDIINMVSERGTIFVGAAGNGSFGPNCGINPDGPDPLFYPASYDNVISISALSPSGCLETNYNCFTATNEADPFHATHNGLVDFLAQGLCVQAITCNQSTIFSYGTSIAAPQVAGVIGLMKSIDPCLGHDEVMEILSATEQEVDAACNTQSYYQNGDVPGIPCAVDAVLMAKDYGKYLINDNQTWTTDRYVRELIIEDGGKLIIKGAEINIAAESNITVEAGGELIVDNSLLTKNCADYWQGIEVHGNTNASQFSQNGTRKVGKLVVKNGGVIEYAHIGARNFDPAQEWATRGGIIKGDNAVFRNCGRAVEFLKYQNFVPATGSSFRDLSAFRNTTFEIDDQFANHNFDAHVTMWGTHDITFNGCHFLDLRTEPVEKFALLGEGIRSIDAAYPVINCTFENLIQGMNVLRAAELRTVRVLKNTTFTNCQIGIDNRSSDFMRVKECVFNVGGYPYELQLPININGASKPYHVGILLDEATDFDIENNEFVGSDTAPTEVGILAMDTNQSLEGGQGAANVLRLNSYRSMDIGELAAGNNANIFDSFDGLRYLCNDNSSSLEHDFKLSSGATIGTIQANLPKHAAENTFSYNGQLYGDFDNSQGNGIFYFYENQGNEEPLFFAPNLTKVLAEGAICESKDDPRDDDEVARVKSDYDALKVQYDNLYNDTYEPRLSPQRQAELATLYGELHLTLNPGIHYYLTADDELRMTEARQWLGYKENVEADMAIIDSWIQTGDYVTARNLVDALPNSHQLPTAELANYQSFKRKITHWLQNGRRLNNFTSNQQSHLRNIANQQTGRAAIQAQNILNYFYGDNYGHQSLAEGIAVEDRDQATEEVPSARMHIYPNPATESVGITLPTAEQSNQQIMVMDCLGKTVWQRTATETTQLDLAAFTPGLYFVQLRAGQTIVETRKLIVQ